MVINTHMAQPPRTTSERKTWQDLKQALPQLHSALAAFNRGARLYRGISHDDGAVRFKHRMQFGQRVSRNTDNYYTLIIDHDPAWSDYPPRSASIICSTMLHGAGGYGREYLLLPVHDPLVGICPRIDFWYSFDQLKQLGEDDWDMNDLNMLIRLMFTTLLYKPELVVHSYAKLREQFDQLDQVIQNPEQVQQLLRNASAYTRELIQNFLTRTSGPMLSRMQKVLEPEQNGFERTHLSEMQPDSGNQEAWFSADCWMIDVAELPYDWKLPGQFDLKLWIQSP